MSLNRQQREATSRELRANLALSGYDASRLYRLTGWCVQRIECTLAVDAADPADVWRLRDLLDEVVRGAGHEPVPYTVLTPSVRRAAAGWFGIAES